MMASSSGCGFGSIHHCYLIKLCCALGASIIITNTVSFASALSPLLATTSTASSAPIKSFSSNDRITKSNNRDQRTRLNLSTGGGSSFYPEPSNQKQQQQQRWTEYTTIPERETPTTTAPSLPPSSQLPSNPKIVLFGATGKMGRRILKKLLSAPIDMDVVAFVRDEQKLDRVLYHDEDLVLGNLLRSDDRDHVATGGGAGGPKLTVIVGDVVARTDVYKGTFETREETRVLDDWVGRAAGYFQKRGWKNGNLTAASHADSNDSGVLSLQDEQQIEEDVKRIEAGDEALEEALSDATIIISCLSSLRISNIWADYLKVPFLRVFRRDASKWCSDATHPYYVNYLSTKKILEFAEREQRKRDAYNEFEREKLEIERERRAMMEEVGDEEEGFESEIASELRKKRSTRREQALRDFNFLSSAEDALELPKHGVTPSSTDRIKFIRISHSMVGQDPFRFLSIVSNVFRSQMTRFEFLGERLMENSKLIDTIVLRPGEVTDIERNLNSTALQLSIDGDVPTPNLGLVGRDDIADLVAVAALTKTSLEDSSNLSTINATRSKLVKNTGDTFNRPHHYTWCLRWTGAGSESAALCFVKAIKHEMKLSRIRKIKEKRLMRYRGGSFLILMRKWMRRMRPHALSVALTVYLTVGAIAWYFFGSTMIELASRARKCRILRFFSAL